MPSPVIFIASNQPGAGMTLVTRAADAVCVVRGTGFDVHQIATDYGCET